MIKGKEQLKAINTTTRWDVVIIGGGASGLGAAVDAASRGFSTILFEAEDFAKGTSSRSTKLVHGGVRYLAQGHLTMVREALKERGLLAKNAAHLFKNQQFAIPLYRWWQRLYYRIGLALYDTLAGRLSIGETALISSKKMTERLPNLISDKLSGGLTYHDGQFDDSRLAINLAQTAIRSGATVINYMKVIDLRKDTNERLTGVVVYDKETAQEHLVHSKVIINATGVFSNAIMNLDGKKKYNFKIVPSQGVHLVVDASFLGGTNALMIPKTKDGRVLFALPWHGKLLMGTTDTSIEGQPYEPTALEVEIDFILDTAAHYLKKKPTRGDVLSVFAGLRPLVATIGEKKKTKEIPRGYKIIVSESGLISILGGKWTTYRLMAETLINTAIQHHGLENKPCVTKELSIYGNVNTSLCTSSHEYMYGSEILKVRNLISQHLDYQQKIHPRYHYKVGEVIWFARYEMARTVEDILARRIRLLFLDAKAAIEAAPMVAKVLARELNRDADWVQQQEKAFGSLAKNYLLR